MSLGNVHPTGKSGFTGAQAKDALTVVGRYVETEVGQGSVAPSHDDTAA